MDYYLGVLLGPVVINASKIIMASASLVAVTVCDAPGFTQIVCDCIKTIMCGM